MKAVFYTAMGEPSVIEIRDVPDPRPARGEVLVRVRAAGLNRADLQQRRGQYPPPPGIRVEIPGLEFAGEVASVGEGVTSVKPGDRVMGIASGEAQAEYLVAAERMLVRIPASLTMEEAGGTMEAFLTAHDALFTLGQLRPGWPVLIHAIGSGVSTAALQLAKAAGATVIGTSRTADKVERARALGLDHGIVVQKGDVRFAEEVRRLTGGEGVPIVLDFVGAAYMAENVASLCLRGRVVVIGTLGGAGAQLDLGMLMRKRGEVIGTVLRPRPLEEKIRATRLFAQDVLPMIASGRLKPIIDSVMPLARAREAHERMERNDSFGKLVLSIPG
jgi:putative PIG3 family NAD(P)H quinone oxidoreductase